MTTEGSANLTFSRKSALPARFYLVIEYVKYTLFLNRLRWLREASFRLQGFRMGSNSQLGKISCSSPRHVILGVDCLVADGVVLDYVGPETNARPINIGDRVHVSHGSHFNIQDSIVIESDVMIGAGCKFVDHDHGFSIGNGPIRSQPLNCAPISIGSDVWIGANCILLKGVEIGQGSVIGAGSVVVKSVPPLQVWAGNPAKFIKQRPL